MQRETGAAVLNHIYEIIERLSTIVLSQSFRDIEIAIFEKSFLLSFFDGLVLFNFYFISDRWGPEIDHDLREVLPSVPKRILE